MSKLYFRKVCYHNTGFRVRKTNKVMNLLDKYILLEANTVSDAEYKNLTGNSLEDFRVRMRQHMAETKRRVEAQKSGKK